MRVFLTTLMAVALTCGGIGLCSQPAAAGGPTAAHTTAAAATPGGAFKTETPSGTSPATFAGRKRALLIGISQYAHKGGKDKDGIHDRDWWNLHTEYDIKLLRDTLTSKKFGFEPGDIRILQTPAETTHAEIVKAIRKLTADTQAGDIVYIHYSGHGQPAPDPTRIDGMVKTIVPSDYVSQLDVSNNIRGDEIGRLLDELKAKNPANITITFDSCFSYSAVRGDTLPTRGGDPLGVLSGRRGLADRADRSENNFLNKLTLPEGYVFLSAASQIETAKEYYIDGDVNKPVGLFTYALTKAMSSSGDTTTYRDIIERVSDFIGTIRQDQSPQIEGRTEQKLFAGEVLPSERYIGVTTKTVTRDRKQEHQVILGAGLLQGVTKGSKFELHPAGTKKREEGKALAVATVTDLDPTTAVLALDPGTDVSKLAAKDEGSGRTDPYGMLRSARAFEIEHNYDSVLKVAVEDASKFRSLKAGQELLANMKLEDLAETVNRGGRDWNVLIRPPYDCGKERGAQDDQICQEEKDFHGVVLQRPDGTVISRIPDDENAQKNLRQALERESRVFIIRELGTGSLSGDEADTSLQVRLRVVPVEVELSDRVLRNGEKGVKKVLGDKTIPNQGDEIKFPAGEYVMLELQNTGDDDAYVTVLDLQPDGKIKPLFPYPGIPHDNLLKRGATYRVPFPFVFRLGVPYGRESFRVIATREPTDFSPLLDPETLERVGRGEKDLGERGGNAIRTPIGRMLRAAQQGKRGDISAAPSEWATDSVTFTVLPPR